MTVCYERQSGRSALVLCEAGYHEYKDHKEDLENFLDQIHDLIDSFYQDPEAGQNLLKSQLSDWFGRHFSSFDARLHRQLG